MELMSMEKPVKVGQELTVNIGALARKGDGVAKVEGFVIFVKGARLNQNVQIKITEVRETFAVGQLLG
jgi:predicted RNA-binding protein with TRAM domain